MRIGRDINEVFLLFSQAVATMEVAAVATRTPVGATTSVRCPAKVAAAATSSSATVAGAVAAALIATTTTGKKTRSRLSTKALVLLARV